MKLFVVAMLFAIVLALFWGLTGVLKGGPGSTRAVKSLTLRIGLSLGLFLLLIIGGWLGWWRPHAL
ncbi:twin transmembrane helix small protein [Neisseriaceae bacterium JH1-16]|nr:twin transmembrane helix small protein [Neisseriaceae bacterium JH1-16]